MPLANLLLPLNPSVPLLAGVPPLSGGLANTVNKVSLVVSDIQSFANAFAGPQWGIFSPNGQPIFLADAVVGVRFREEYRVADYPIETGGFMSYNKVATPYDVEVRFAIGTSVAKRSALLGALRNAISALTLFTVATPEYQHTNVTIVSLNYEREDRNAGLLVIDVGLQEVRQSVSTTYGDAEGGPDDNYSDLYEDDGAGKTSQSVDPNSDVLNASSPNATVTVTNASPGATTTTTYGPEFSVPANAGSAPTINSGSVQPSTNIDPNNSLLRATPANQSLTVQNGNTTTTYGPEFRRGF